MRIKTIAEARLASKIINQRVSLRVNPDDLFDPSRLGSVVLSREWGRIDPLGEMSDRARKHVYGRIKRHRHVIPAF